MTINEVLFLSNLVDQTMERLDKAASNAVQSRIILETARKIAPGEVQKAKQQYEDLTKQFEGVEEMVLELTGLDSTDDVRRLAFVLQQQARYWQGLHDEVTALRTHLTAVEKAGHANFEEYKYGEELDRLHRTEQILFQAEKLLFETASRFEIPDVSKIEIVSPTLARIR